MIFARKGWNPDFPPSKSTSVSLLLECIHNQLDIWRHLSKPRLRNCEKNDTCFTNWCFGRRGVSRRKKNLFMFDSEEKVFLSNLEVESLKMDFFEEKLLAAKTERDKTGPPAMVAMVAISKFLSIENRSSFYFWEIPVVFLSLCVLELALPVSLLRHLALRTILV